MGLRLLLPAFLLACGGDSSGPRDADVVGTWLVTFTTTGACQLGQIALILSESPSGAPLGNHGSYVISCVGVADEIADPGPVVNWSVSEDRFSLQVTNTPKRQLTGTLTADELSWSGTFTWLGLVGTFTAVRQ